MNTKIVKKFYNFAAKDFEDFDGLSKEDVQKKLSDWNTMALHPILNCDDSWMIMFENMSIDKFFKNLEKQEKFLIKSIETKLSLIELKKNMLNTKRYSQTYENTETGHKALNKKLKIEKRLDERLKDVKKESYKLLTNKQIRVAIDGNKLNEKYIDKCILLFDKLIKKGIKEIKVLVSASNKTVDSKIDYYYNEKELGLLKKLEEKLNFYNCLTDSKQYKSEIKFSEFLTIPGEMQGYNKLYSMKDIEEAYNFTDEIVCDIKKYKFTPLEAIVYIYNTLTNTFTYNIPDDPAEEETVCSILGKKNDELVCAGISSYFNLIIQKLNDPNLKSNFLNLENSLCKDEYHAINLVDIKDKNYKIDGVYCVDMTYDMKKDKDSTSGGTLGCLFKLNELINSPDDIATIMPTNLRIEQTMYNFDSYMRDVFNKTKKLDEKTEIAKIQKNVIATKKIIETIARSKKNVYAENIIKAYINILDKMNINYNFYQIKALIVQNCIKACLQSSVNSSYPWLELLNKNKIKKDYTDYKKCDYTNALEKYVAQNVPAYLISIEKDENDFTANMLTNKDYFNDNYYKLLENVKKHIDCKEANNPNKQ